MHFLFRVGKRVFHLVNMYMVFRMKLAKAAKPPIASITHSLPLCDELALRLCPLTFLIDFYENLTLRKYAAIQYLTIVFS